MIRSTQRGKRTTSAALGAIQNVSWVSRLSRTIWSGISAVAGIGVIAVLVIFAWEYSGALFERDDDPAQQAARPPISALAPRTEGSAITPSDVVGEAVARLEADTLRQRVLIETEAEARLKAVESMLRNRELQLAVEAELRKQYQERGLEAISTANLPHLVFGFVEAFSCTQSPQGCGNPTATARMMVDFWRNQAQNLGEPDLDFDRRARQAVAGYDPDTNTWSNGVDVFLQEHAP